MPIPLKPKRNIMKKFKTTTIALTFSALALALSACQITPSSQTTTQSANTAIDQAIRANSKASTQHTKQMATANKLNHISYANVAYDNINERQKNGHLFTQKSSG